MHENRMSCEKLGVDNALLDIRDCMERVFDSHNQAITLLKNLVACMYNPALEWRRVAERAEHYLLGREEGSVPSPPTCEHMELEGK